MGSYFSQVLHEANLSGGRSLTVYSTKAKKEEDHYTKRLVAALPHLENLSVEKCKLKILPPILATLQELRSLSLVDNELRAFPVLKVGLKRLILSRNSLPFPLEVLDLPSLEVLDLSFNEITSVPESLPAKLSNLVRLNLSHNKLSEFPTSVLSLSNITSLDLSFCNLNGQLPAPEALGKLKRNLKELNLAGNGLTHLHGVENLHNVEVLSLGRNVLDTFPELIASKLPTLRVLDLSHNKIVQLPPAIAKLSEVSVLKLNGNRILVVPKEIKALKQLTELYLHENIIHKVSKQLCHCNSLQRLALEFNQLSRLPGELKQLDSLHTLTLHNNKFRLLPEPLYSVPFVNHLFALTLDGNDFSEHIQKAIREKGAREFVVQREIQQTQEENSNTSSKKRPGLQRLASQYGTMRGPGSAAATPSPSPFSFMDSGRARSMNLSPSAGDIPRSKTPDRPRPGAEPAPVSTRPQSVDPATLKAMRRNSSGTPGTGVNESNMLLRLKAESQQRSQSPRRGSAGAAELSNRPSLALLLNTGIRGASDLKGTMPSYPKFKEAFESLIQSLDLSSTLCDELRKKNTEEKWELLKMYKGNLIDLLSNNEEKLARDKKFEEWQKRDKKIKALSDASPEYFLMPLRNLSITMSDMTSLKVLLEAAPLPWIYHFLDSQGLALTIKFLEHIVFKEPKGPEEVVCESGAMFILAYFLKNENIASLVLNTPGAVSAITLCLQASELQTRKGAMELLYDISRTHPFAPQLIQQALDNFQRVFRKSSAFQVFVENLSNAKLADPRVKAYCIGVINRLIESKSDLIERYKLRKQIHKAGLRDAIAPLDQLPDELLQKQLQQLEDSATQDEEDVKTLAATDYRVLLRIQDEDEEKPVLADDTSDGSAGSSSASTPTVSPSASTDSIPKKSKGLSVSIPTQQPAGPPTIAGRKVIRVLVSDIGALSIMYGDTTTVEEVLKKILNRHDFKNPERFGLFFVLTDRETGRVEGFWQRDNSATIASLLNSSSEAVVSYKMLPWKLKVECPTHNYDLSVELEPSWTVGQAIAHIVSSAPSHLSLDLDYDLFIKPIANSEDGTISSSDAGKDKLKDTSVLSDREDDILASATLMLYDKPQDLKIFLSDETSFVSLEVDQRWTGKEIVCQVIKKLPELQGKEDDYGLIIEQRKQNTKKTKKPFAKTSKNAIAGPNANPEENATPVAHYVEPHQTLSVAGFDNKKQRLRFALVPREVFVSLSESPPGTPTAINAVITTGTSSLHSSSVSIARPDDLEESTLGDSTLSTASAEALQAEGSTSVITTDSVDAAEKPQQEEAPKSPDTAVPEIVITTGKDTSEVASIETVGENGPVAAIQTPVAESDPEEPKEENKGDSELPTPDTELTSEQKKGVDSTESPNADEAIAVAAPAAADIGSHKASRSSKVNRSPKKKRGEHKKGKSDVSDVEDKPKLDVVEPTSVSKESTNQTQPTHAPAESPCMPFDERRASTDSSQHSDDLASRAASLESLGSAAGASRRASVASETTPVAALPTRPILEAKLTLGFEETVSTLIRMAVAQLKAGAFSGNYSLYKDGKLLSRRKTLRDAGVLPGDHLALMPTEDNMKVINHAGESAGDESGNSSVPAPPPLQLEQDIYDEPSTPDDKYERFEATLKTNSSLSCATLNKLILRLTDPDDYDKQFSETFLLTYRSFTTADLVLQKLIQRYRAPPGKVPADKVDTVRVRVLVFMTNWLDRDYQELDERVIEQLNIWVETEVDPERRPILLKTLNRVRERKSGVELLPPVELRFKGSKAPKLIDLDPLEIARQLTLDTWLIYVKVKPVEFFDLAWTKSRLQHLSPNVLALIERFNYYSTWVVTEIVSEKKLRARRALVAKIIKICEHLRELNNFHILYAFISAMSNSAVSRLKWTSEKLNKSAKTSLSELESLMAMEGSFRNYRDAMKNTSNLAVVPYIGVILKDLTFIEDGNPNAIDDLINWSKRKLVFDVVGDYLRGQIVPYKLHPLTVASQPMSKILYELPQLDESEQYDNSLKCEPRGAKLEQLQ